MGARGGGVAGGRGRGTGPGTGGLAGERWKRGGGEAEVAEEEVEEEEVVEEEEGGRCLPFFLASRSSPAVVNKQTNRLLKMQLSPLATNTTNTD